MIPAPRWERVKELFAAAVPLEAARRAAFLSEQCGADDTLRGEIDSLLSAHDGAGAFLAAENPTGPARPPDGAAMVGRRLGPYRIVRLIGRGGMGEVSLAVRDDDQFQKLVAVKLIRRGLDDEAMLARFRAERQILARLEHPGIARLIDAGATEEGWPFFVMEHVEGLRIDAHADTQRLGRDARLALFRSVCAAVQYAHQNLVVHRDIKPANILVTAEGHPKLLDFGVAKLLDPAAGPATSTAFAPMTPAYASPEQIVGQPISTATDVYSLGVVLYELLTGRLPYDAPSGQPMEVLKAVVEQEPRRAGLHGDLDDILMMALRKEPPRRYASVEALSEDVRRFLDGLPVAASKGTLGYRAGKFVRRNRLAVGAAIAVCATLVGGIVTTAWQARVARAERARAERRFADVRRLANAMLFDFHDKIRDLPGSTDARQLLVTHALNYLDSLAGEAAGDAGLQRELAAAYRRVGDVQGQSGAANLGDPAGAASSYRKALALYAPLAAAAPQDLALQSEVVDGQLNLARLQEDAGDLDGAMATATAALAVADQLAARAPGDGARESSALRGAILLGRLHVYRGDFDQAVAVLRAALSRAEAALAAKPGDAALRGALIQAYLNLARALRDARAFDDSLALYRKALPLYETLRAEDPLSVRARRGIALVLLESGYVLAGLERWAEALANGERAVAITLELQKADPANVEPQRSLLLDEQLVCRARTHTTGRVPPECASAVARAQALVDRQPGQAAAHILLAYAYSNLAGALQDTGQHAAAVKAFQRELQIAQAESSKTPDDQRTRALAAEAHAGLGKAAAAEGRWAAALASYQEAIALMEPAAQRGNPEGRATLVDLLCALGGVHARRAARGPAAERRAAWTDARASYRRALDVLDRPQPGQEVGAADAAKARQKAARGLEETERALASRS